MSDKKLKKTVVTLTIDQSVKDIAQVNAKNETRSLSNYISSLIIKDHIKVKVEAET